MSNPFPLVQPGGVIQDPGIGGIIGSGLQGVIAAMQEREKLERERQEFESKQAYFKTLDTGNQLDNEKKRGELKKEQRQLEARGQGLDAYQQWVGGGAQQTALGPILARIKDPDTAQDFVDRVTKHRSQENEAAIVQQNQAQAQVATATVEPEITGKKAQARKAESDANVAAATEGTQIAQDKAQLQYTKALAAKALADAQKPKGPDEQTIRVAIEEWKSGAGPIGPIYKKYGIPLPEGTDPNKMYEPQTRGMAVWKAQQKQSAVAALQAHEIMTSLTAEGVKISRATALKAKVPLGMGRSMIPEKEQMLLDASGVYVSRYTQSVSGLAATDSEREFISRQVAPMTGDKPAATKQKEIMREGMTQTMFDASQGAERPVSDILGDVINAARAKGADANTIKFFQQSRMKALKMERVGIKAGATGSDDDVPEIADDQPGTPDSVSTFLQGYGR